MTLDIRIWNVNHGNSASIKLPNGNVMMIDCASNPKTGFSPINRTKNLWKCELGYLIISHPHMDHISDIVKIDSFKPVTLLRPKIDYLVLRNGKSNNDLDIINKYIEFQEPYTAPCKPPNAPSKEWREDVEIKNYHLKGEQSDLNNYSFVTFISYDGFHFASGGDLTTKGWENLIEQEGEDFEKRLARVNFFEASHHGRKEGFNSIIFEDMNPCLVLVSDKEEQDTSVTGRYSKYCKGWDINNENTGKEEKDRKVLTTRSDGRIKISVDKSDKTYVSVSTKLSETT